MKKEKPWFFKLNKKEIIHLFEQQTCTLEDFKKTRRFQIKSKQQNPESPEPCWKCKSIAIKLGLEV